MVDGMLAIEWFTYGEVNNFADEATACITTLAITQQICLKTVK